MFEAIFIFFILFLFFGFNQIVKAIEQERYEKERFSLLVAQELDRLQKAIEENNGKIREAEAMLQPEGKWWGRN